MPVATKGKPLTQAVAEAAPNPPPAAPVVVEAVPAKPADTVTVVQTVVPDDKPAIKVVEPPLAKIVEEARKDMPKPTVVTVVQTDAPVKVADKPVSKDDNVVTVVKAPQPIKASLTIDVKTDKPITDEIKKEDKAVKAEVKKEEKAVKDEIKKEEKAAKQEEKQEQKQIKQVEKEIKKELPKKTSTIVVVASEPVKEPSIVVAEPVVVPKIVPRGEYGLHVLKACANIIQHLRHRKFLSHNKSRSWNSMLLPSDVVVTALEPRSSTYSRVSSSLPVARPANHLMQSASWRS